MTLPAVLKEMLSLPTAPFVETAVLDYIRRTCQGLKNVTIRADRHGNLLARYRHKPRGVQPLLFTAHTDHPGFVARRMQGEKELLADFRGWVDPAYFPGTRVRFWQDDRWVRGVVDRVTRAGKHNRHTGRTAPPKEVAIRVPKPIQPGAPGMWDLTEPVLKKGLVHARGCDDIAGAASLIELLRRLSRKGAAADAYCMFTRAEEVGFIGAIAAAKDGTVPRKCPVIAIETSKALSNAPQGAGPVLRVGDKSSVFSPSVTDFCARVAHDLERRRKSFRFQRRLMDGGTCESTAFVAYGYLATGICIALGNYHNMDEKRRKIAAETIHLEDWKLLVDWYEAMVMDKEGFNPRDGALHTQLDKHFARFEKMLASSSK
jgi:endoglucanase